jgi:hypothetical protein
VWQENSRLVARLTPNENLTANYFADVWKLEQETALSSLPDQLWITTIREYR